MQHDPRESNSPPAPIEPTGFFAGIQIRPILMGVVVDIIATMVILSLYYSLYVVPGASKWDAFGNEAAAYWLTEEGLLASFLIGSLGTLIGGFYAAYKVGTLETKHGALVGVGSVILGLVLQGGSEGSAHPEWFVTLSAAAAIPAGALGGFLAEMFKSGPGLSKPSPNDPGSNSFA